MMGRLSADSPESEDARRPAAHDAETYERDRQRAVDGLPSAISDERFEHILALARRSFGTPLAAFTVIDRDRQVVRASVGPRPIPVSRADSFCATTIRGRGPLVVQDARSDVRFRESSLVTGKAQVRFYAGYPIESQSGERIGALCVLDRKPRRMSKADLVLLREFAMLLQRELWLAAE
jgi:GAF domain-containing protein